MSSAAKDNAAAAGLPVYDSVDNGYLRLRGGDPNQLYIIGSDGHIHLNPSGGTSGSTQKISSGSSY